MSDDWFARPWRSDEGLPDNNVTGIAQTTDGFLWVGTAGGLVRFDGDRFDEFSPPNVSAPFRAFRAASASSPRRAARPSPIWCRS